jgi:hypothetical protein
MDAARRSHYVRPSGRSPRAVPKDAFVQFLLFLSAMLAGLTGFMSGERSLEPRQVEQAVAIASVLAEAAPTAAVAVAPAALPAVTVGRSRATLPPATPRLATLARVDERRLE